MSHNYTTIIADEWCDRLGIPRGTPAQTLLNDVMASSQPAGRCETCRHWWQWVAPDDPYDGDKGYCRRVTVKPDAPVLAYCENGSIVTYRAFGCVQWEAKE